MFKGKASADEEVEHTREYVSILKRQTTQPLGLSGVFEITLPKHIAAYGLLFR